MHVAKEKWKFCMHHLEIAAGQCSTWAPFRREKKYRRHECSDEHPKMRQLLQYNGRGLQDSRLMPIQQYDGTGMSARVFVLCPGPDVVVMLPGLRYEDRSWSHPLQFPRWRIQQT